MGTAATEYRVEHDVDWPPERIVGLLKAAASCRTFPARFRLLVRPFIEAETPYVRPETIPSPQRGVLSLTLSRFSCSSFIHFLAALGHATGYEEFVRTVRTIRYGRRVAPEHFIHDLRKFMARMVRSGVVTNLYPIFANHSGKKFRAGGWLSAADVRKIEPLLRCGDVLFFRGTHATIDGAKKVIHTAFVYKFDDTQSEAFVLHSGATERGPVQRKLGCVAIARWTPNDKPAPGAHPSHLRLHEYLETRQRFFSHVAIFRIAPLT